MADRHPQDSSTQTGIHSDRYLRLFEALSPLVGSHCVEDLVQAACRLVADALEVEACSILLHDAPTGRLVLQCATHIPEDQWPSIRLPADSGLCGRCFIDANPLLLREDADFKRYGLTPKSEYGRPSCIVAPLRIRGLPRGVINIANPMNGRLFNERDVKLIEAVGALIGGGIENADQFRETIRIHEHLEGIFDTLHVGVLALNSALEITHSNHRMREMLGDPRGALGGRSLAEALDPGLIGVCRRLIRQAGAEEPICQDRYAGEMGGRELSLEITASRLTLGGGCGEDWLLMFDDVGQAEEVKRLRAADSLKGAFLRIISHELRTPLTVIRGSLPVLESYARNGADASDDALARVQKILKSNVARMVGVVNTILEVVEIENGSLKLVLQPCDLNELLRRGAKAAREASGDKQLEWKLELDEKLPRIEVDGTRLGQTFYELFDNAIKFSPPGAQIAIRTERAGDQAVIRIANRGEPIPPECRPEVFEKFHQIDSSRTRQTGGCGLGLYLSRAIVRLHGGSIQIVDGEPDQTVFEIRLPLGAERPQPSASDLPSAEQRL